VELSIKPNFPLLRFSSENLKISENQPAVRVGMFATRSKRQRRSFWLCSYPELALTDPNLIT